MKKMLFTAIALLAFAGTSMANTKEIKTIQIIESKNSNLEDLRERSFCDKLWIHWYEYALNELGAAPGSDGAWNFADTLSSEMGC